MTCTRLETLLQHRGTLVLDGALATELEQAGCDLDHPLWSARVLLAEPEKIAAVHRAYLEAGCDILSSASYQASIPGFMNQGLARGEAEHLYREAIRIASRERDEFVARHHLAEDRSPIVAVSVGPYGAYLADGSEYRGEYSVSLTELEHLHRERMELIAEEVHAGHADLVACETLPSLAEAQLLARLLETLEVPGWISFACRDERSTCEGQDLAECARALNNHEHVIGIGVNCTAPGLVPRLLERLRAETHKPLVAYPNSGEVYDVETRSWSGQRVLADAYDSASRWRNAGASLIGGCCRTRPDDIARLVAWRDQLAWPAGGS